MGLAICTESIGCGAILKMPREIITSVEPPGPQRALPCLGSPTQVVSDEFVTISRFDDAPLEEEEIEVLRLTKLRPWSRMQLDAAAELILRQSLNGGGSGQSEAMAFEVLTRLHRCRLVGTEDQVKYCRRSPVADMVFEKGAERVGVSVTRVYEYCKKPLVFDSVCDLLGKMRRGLPLRQTGDGTRGLFSCGWPIHARWH